MISSTARITVKESTPQKSVEQLLLEIFSGNPYHSRGGISTENIYYTPVERPLTIEDLEAHTAGDKVLGSYQLCSDNTVKWLGWDIDSSNLDEAKALVLQLVKYLEDVPYAVEFSGGKGYHVLVFLKEPMLASEAKQIADWVHISAKFKKSGETHVEAFPKQAELTEEHAKGSLLKIPLGYHLRTKEQSRFVDIRGDWEQGAALDPLNILLFRATPKQLEKICKVESPYDQQLIDLLVPYWKAGVRHSLSLYLCGYLAHEGVGSEQVKDIIREIVRVSGDPEERNRIQTVKNTFKKHRAGKGIRGRQGLGEVLSVSSMVQLTEIVAQLKAPNTVTQIDDLRYAKKKPKLECARLAAHTIWTHLSDDESKIFQDKDGNAYWYNDETHLIVASETDRWLAMLNQRFGLNPMDIFSKLTMIELKLRILREAPVVAIHNKAFWEDGKKILYVNLGGPEVYIVKGKNDIEVSYNGQCGIMFKTNWSDEYTIPDFDAARQDVWTHLIKDLSFTTSTDAPAKPDEQRELLKAWILAYFFQEILPTKPILTLIGTQGSGKTTAIRRILRILEDPHSDVLSVVSDKPDAFRATISEHRIVALDNLETSKSRWLVDMLNKLSTGAIIELRKLYHTNVKYVLRPKCFVACTAITLPFSDEQLFSRLLILEMAQLPSPRPEYILQKQIKEFAPAIWADLIIQLSEIVGILATNPTVRPPTKSRLVDFTVFCQRIKSASVVNGEYLTNGLLSMVDAQLRQLRDSSPAIAYIEDWCTLRPQEAAEWRTMSQLYEVLSTMAQARGKRFKWSTAHGLARHLQTLQARLVTDFQAEFKEDLDPITRRSVTKLRFNVTLT